MAISFISSINNTGVGTSVAVNKPTGVVAGNLLIAILAQVGNGAATPTFTAPAGFNAIANATNGSSGISLSMYSKLTTSGDVSESSYTFTLNNVDNKYAVLGMLYIENNNGANSFLTPASASGTGTTITVGSITPAIADNLLIFATSASNSVRTFSSQAIATSNPSWTEAFDTGHNDTSLAVAYAIRPQTTGTGNATATISGASTSWTGMITSIYPRKEVLVSETLTILDTLTTVATKVFNKLESIAITDILNINKNIWRNEDKNISTWTNQDKS